MAKSMRPVNAPAILKTVTEAVKKDSMELCCFLLIFLMKEAVSREGKASDEYAAHAEIPQTRRDMMEETMRCV